MTQTHHPNNIFVGCDVSKADIAVSILDKDSDRPLKSFKVLNSKTGLKKLLKEVENLGQISMCVFEPTGGYEILLAETLHEANWYLHRADTRKASAFARSLNQAKTDPLDAFALALYGRERKTQLRRYIPLSALQVELKTLVTYRGDLVKEQTRLKNRAQCIAITSLQKKHLSQSLKSIKVRIKEVEEAARALIKSCPTLKAKYDAATSCHGVGPVSALVMVALVPELGTINRKQVSALVGLVPYANQSGNRAGYQKTGKGRSVPRQALFMAALAASRAGVTKEQYERLRANGKKPMVALIAVARKLAEHINAKCKIVVMETQK